MADGEQRTWSQRNATTLAHAATDRLRRRGAHQHATQSGASDSAADGGRFGLGLGGALLAALQAGIAGAGELVLELLDAAGRVDELQLARVERMASVANIDLQLRLRAAGDERSCRSRT